MNHSVEWKDVTMTKTAGKEGSASAYVPSENGSQTGEVRVVGETGSCNDDRTSVSAMCIDTCESFRRQQQGDACDLPPQGVSVGEGRMDITPILTEDPEKNMTVQRSTRYGCSFDNDVFADVPEELSVFRFAGEAL